MATQEVTLRPGDSLSLLIDIPGQPMRLDLNLTPAGVAVAAALPAGAPTLYGGAPAAVEEEPIDLDAQFDAEDSSAEVPSIHDVQSLAAVEPYENAVPAPAPEAVEMEEVIEEEIVEEIAEDDLMLGDIDDSVEPEQFPEQLNEEPAAIDIPEDDDDLGLGGDIDIPDDDDLGLGGDIDIPDDDDLGLGGDIDIPEDDDLGLGGGIDIPEDDDLGLGGGIDIPEDDDDLGLGGDIDIPEDDLPLETEEQAGFVADGATMVPPTEDDDLPLDDDIGLEEESELQGKDKHQPNVDDTLPVWKKKASSYKDPELETKKKATGKIPKPAPAKKPALAKKGALLGKKGALPGKKGSLPGKKGPLPGKKKGTGQVAPPAAAAGGTGNFTVFLSPPRSEEKKETAAEIIAEVQGIDMGAAKTLAGKMIIKVINGVSEDEAQGVRDKFKEAGLSCRITKKR